MIFLWDFALVFPVSALILCTERAASKPSLQEVKYLYKVCSNSSLFCDDTHTGKINKRSQSVVVYYSVNAIWRSCLFQCMIQIANLVTTCSFYQTLLVFNWKGQKKLGTYLIHSFINVQTVQAVASLIFIKRERTDIRTIFITSVVIVLKIFVQIKRLNVFRLSVPED